MTNAAPVSRDLGLAALRTENRGGVLIVTLDQPGDAVNKVDRELGAAVEAVLQEVERDRTVYAMVITSGKPDIFIAGADESSGSMLATMT